jgi:hypothetical protein
MKKSTLVLVAIAVAVVGSVYWFEFKRTPTEKTQTNPSIFHFQPEQVDSVTFSRPDQTIVAARQGSGWQITQPVQTRGDSGTITALLNDLTLAHSSRSLSPSAGQLKSFGLAPASLTLEFQLKDGSRHRLQVGSADFSGTSVYAQADQSPQVLLIPDSVLTDGNKTLDQLRDNSVLGISAADVNGLDLKTPSGDFQIARAAADDAAWSIQKPVKLIGDVTAINQLIANVSSAKLTQVVSENADQLARYGLAHPSISLQVQLDSGADRTLDLGARKGDQFYARDSSRNMIFLVPASLDKELDQNLFDLRDKLILHSLPEAFTRIDYHSASLRPRTRARKSPTGRSSTRSPRLRRKTSFLRPRLPCSPPSSIPPS